MEQWEKVMTGFVPDDMLSFELESGEKEIFFEDIDHTTIIR